MLILRKPWTRQPQTPIGIDWGNPITNGLLLSALPNAFDGRNLVNGKSLTKTGALAAAVNQDGVYPTFATNNYVDFDAGICSYTTPTTIAWTQEPRATSNYSAILQWKATGATNPFLIYTSATDVNYQFNAGVGNGGFNLNKRFGVGLATNKVADRFCLILPSGTSTAADSILYRNGALVDSLSVAAEQSFGSSTANVSRIGALSTAGDPFEGLLGNVNVWGRALTETEAAAWTRNPWQLFAPQQIIIPTPAAATVPTLSASTYVPGSMTSTGWRPQITAS